MHVIITIKIQRKTNDLCNFLLSSSFILTVYGVMERAIFHQLHAPSSYSVNVDCKMHMITTTNTHCTITLRNIHSNS